MVFQHSFFPHFHNTNTITR